MVSNSWMLLDQLVVGGTASRPSTAVGLAPHAWRAQSSATSAAWSPRERYSRVTEPVTLAYGDHDWSRVLEREANRALLSGARWIALNDTGHFAALEQPARFAEILLATADT